MVKSKYFNMKGWYTNMKVYLIRHSESIDDIENCYGGIADFDLTENGKNKVVEARKQIDCYGIEKIYSSPYKRAYQTAQILNENLKVEFKVIDDIRELNSHGILSGVNKELAKHIFSYVFQKEEYKNTGYYLGKTFLGGEDSEGLNSIAIITHGGVFRSIFKNILHVNRKIEHIDDVATAILEYDAGKFDILEMKGIEFGENIE